MPSRKGRQWSSLGVIVLTALLAAGVVWVLPLAGGTATPYSASVSLTSAPAAPVASPLAAPGATPAPLYRVLNESTLVLSNGTFAPGDFLSSSAGLPSLETFDQQTDEVFVESFYSGLIDVISGISNKVIATVSTGAYPNTIAYDPQNNNFYFGLQTYDEVSVVNASTDLIQRTVNIGFEPLSMAADPNNGNLFVTGWNSTGTAFLAVLAGSSGVVVKTLSFGANRFPVAGPNGIVYDPANGEFYIPSYASGVPEPTQGNLTLVNAAHETVVGNISLRFAPSSILYAPSNGDFYLGNETGRNLSVFDPTSGKVVGTVQIPDTPSMLAYDSTTQTVFVGITGNVTVVSTKSNADIATFTVTRNPAGLAYDPVNRYVYISDYNYNNVSVVNATTYRVVGSALLGSSPYNMAYDTSNHDLYVTDLLSSQLIVVRGGDNRVIGTVPLGTTPYGIVYDPLTQDLYVTDYYAGNVSIVNGTTNRVVGYLPAGTNPWAIAYDGANHDLYVTNPGSDNITVLNPATHSVVTSLQLSTPPGAIAFDPYSSTLFVGEYNLGNVSVYNAVTNAFLRNSTTGSEPYTISVDPHNGHAFVGNYASDNVTVLGPTGAELGLSAAAGVGVFGSVYDPDDGNVYVVSFSSELVTVINGTTGSGVGGYSTGVGPVAAAVCPGTGMVFVANYDSDSLTLLSPSFRVTTYNVTFHETGLPGGTAWLARLDGVGHSGTSASIVFAEPNGTGQPYWIAPIHGYSLAVRFGSVAVNGHAVTVTVAFVRNPTTYLVTFTETGLPSGTVWSVTIGSSTKISGTTTISFSEPNGTFAYRVGILSGYHAKDTGDVTVHGAAASVTVAFSRTTYIVRFTETGLASGTNWCVTFNGVKTCSTTNTVSFSGIANGTYSYTIAPVTGYNLTQPYSGKLTVAGGGPGTVSNTVQLVWKP